jgi:hypothetical protein
VIRRAALLAVPLVATACMGGDATEEPAARYLVFTEAIDEPQQAVWIGDVNGNKMRRLTRGAYGLVSPDGTKIAVSRRAGIFTVDPGGGGEHFVAKGRPGAWLPDSRHLLAVQGKALVSVDVGDMPRRFSSNGYYGVRPFSWVRGRPLLLATVPTEWGNELALVDSSNGSARKPDLDPRPGYASPMYADHPSTDGLHVVGAACGAEWPCTIQIYSVADGRAKDVFTGRVSWPDWNR